MKSETERQIRIYFESMEQGANFIKPIVEKIVKKLDLRVKINLICLVRGYKNYSKKIAPIIFWKDHDILLTYVDGEEEIPLLAIEFSNAVFTEDHELQRFDGLVASAENNTVYAKISPLNKKSQYQHGGNIDFDYIRPYALTYKKYKKLLYHFDWECDEKGLVMADKDYLSCPNKIEEFEVLVEEVIKQGTKSNNSDWNKTVENNLTKEDYFKKWIDEVKICKLEDKKELNTSRLKIIKEILELKLNRFGHAMDPERGMLAYYGTLHPHVVSKMLFNKDNDAWYKDTYMEKEIDMYIDKNGLRRAYDFLYCFMLGSGLYKSKYFSKLVSNYEDSNDKTLNINITSFLENQYAFLNKALRTIFKFSKSFYIEDNKSNKRIIFQWNEYNKKEKYDKFSNITEIRNRTFFDEDIITYISIHNILKPNGYEILAVSYPGAQADRVVLVAPGTGRRQQRRYIDIISFIPNKFTSLQENKGKFYSKQIQREINELSKYKSNPTYKKALSDFLVRFEETANNGVIKIGFGFWSNKEFRLDKIKNLDLKDLDYFIYVTKDMDKWKIWRSGSSNMFKINEGEVNLPESFEVVKNKIDSNQTQLS